jgi:hypothetical protein
MLNEARLRRRHTLVARYDARRCDMWKALRDLLTRASEDLGIEVPGLPDLGAVGDTVTGAAEAISDQAGQAASELAGSASGVATTVQEAASNAAEQGVDATTAAGGRSRG